MKISRLCNGRQQALSVKHDSHALVVALATTSRIKSNTDFQFKCLISEIYVFIKCNYYFIYVHFQH